MAAEQTLGGTVGVELDPGGAPNVFTDVTGVMDFTFPTWEAPIADASAHEDRVSRAVQPNRINQGIINLVLNLDTSDSTHSETTGFFDQMSKFELRGITLTGPPGSAEVVIFSAFCVSTEIVAENSEAVFTLNVGLQPSGPFLWNAVTVG